MRFSNRIFPKYAAILAAALASTVCRAASPEDSYLAARDKYVAKFKKLEDANKVDDRAMKQEERARADLAEQLQKIVEPVGVEGAGRGKISLETLFSSEVGADPLDGLVYPFGEERQLLATSRGLFDKWLAARQKNWMDGVSAPRTLDQALRSESFYTLAISPDAAVVRYADLPVSKPATADAAFAMLDLRSQDIGGSSLPREIVVALARAGKILIVSAPVRTKIVADSACEKIWTDHESKAKAALDAYSAGGRKDESLFERYSRLQDEGSAAFRKCFSERAEKSAFFPALVKEAQALVDRLSPK